MDLWYEESLWYNESFGSLLSRWESSDELELDYHQQEDCEIGPEDYADSEKNMGRVVLSTRPVELAYGITRYSDNLLIHDNLLYDETLLIR